MIYSSAPTRIDLAGGTLDLWPLHLFFGNPPTLNAAINLYATVRLKTRRDKAIHVESKDLGIQAKFARLERLPERHPLELPLRLIKFYRPKTGLELVTQCAAPAGSGIGGSSALNIALNGALNRLTRSGYSKEQMIEIAKNVETQVIDVPAGTQDYYAAMYGGAQAIHPETVRLASRNIPLDLADWTRRFVLCYSGKPHDSGINNWEVYKQAINGNRKVRRNLQTIADITVKMETVLRKHTTRGFAPLFDAECKARQKLAPGIRTPTMDRLVFTARDHGALAAKVCGAGGGGCVAFFVRPEKKEAVADALNKVGGQVLDFKFVRRGLVVQTG